jgi:hypothetical protein
MSVSTWYASRHCIPLSETSLFGGVTISSSTDLHPTAAGSLCLCPRHRDSRALSTAQDDRPVMVWGREYSRRCVCVCAVCICVCGCGMLCCCAPGASPSTVGPTTSGHGSRASSGSHRVWKAWSQPFQKCKGRFPVAS